MEKKIEELEMGIEFCMGCPLSGDKVIARGNINSKIMIVGEAPGEEEVRQKIPFVGPAGQKLSYMLKQIGLNEEDYYITNVCKCRPPGNRKPTREEMSACSYFLKKQMDIQRPKVVILLGGTALELIAQKTGITKCAGKPIARSIDGKDDSTFLFPILHPAAVLHNPKYRAQFELNFRSLKEFLVDKKLFPEKTKDSPNRVHDDKKQEDKTGLTGKVWEVGKSADVVYAINTEVERETPEHDWAHLHAHTEHSLLDAVGRIQAVINQYVRLGFKSATITDHGTMSGCYSFYKAAKKSGLKPILGIEAYICNNHMVRDKKDSEKRHIILLAKNLIGYKNLLKLSTLANKNGFYYKPRIDYNLLKEYKKGIIALTACVNSVLRLGEGEAALQGLDVKEKNLLILKKIFGKDLYVEIMPHFWEDQIRFNKEVLQVAKKHKVKAVITNDNHYIFEDDIEAHRVITSQAKRIYTITGLHITTENEMRNKLRVSNPDFNADELFDNVKEVVNKIDNYEIPIGKNIIPEPIIPKQFKSAEKYFDFLVEQGFANRVAPKLCNKTSTGALLYPPPSEKLKVYEDRLKLEIEQIKSLGFMKYFLIICEFLYWCKDNDIDYHTRGSAGGSLVAYCLYITALDPIRYEIIFERFISPNRSDLPDIDVDVEDRKRHLVIQHLKDVYGEECVAHMEIWVKMTGRMCLRDVSRYCEVPQSEVGRITHTIIQRSGGDARVDYTIKDSFEQFEVCRQFDKQYPRVKSLAMRLESALRNKGTHAAGIFVGPDPLCEYLPLERSNKVIYHEGEKKGTERLPVTEMVTAYDPHEGEELGLLKLDILGVNTLSVIRYAEELIGKRIDWDSIDQYDEKVFEEFSEGHNIGVFQMESLGLTKMAKSMGIESFRHIIALNAMHRPGPLHSGLSQELIRVKHGYVEKRKRHKIYNEVCKSTFGVVLYQEQVLQMLKEIGGMDWGKINVARKIMKHSKGVEAFGKQRDMFIKGAKELHKISEKESKDLFDEIITFGSYGFNRAHASLYAVISFKCMYLKTHYPKEYMAALLELTTKEDRVYRYISECRRLGIAVAAPDINQAAVSFKLVKDSIMAGLSLIDGLGASTAQQIIENRPYESIRDLLTRVPRISTKIIQNLAAAGAFDNLYISRKAVYDNAEWISNELKGIGKSLSGGQYVLDGWMKLKDRVDEKIWLDSGLEWSEKDLDKMQQTVLNLPSAKHLIEHYKEFIDNLPEWVAHKFMKIMEIDFEESYPIIYIAGSIKPWQINWKIVGMEGGALASDKIKDEGTKYLHANCEDGTDFVLLHISPKQYQAHKEFWDRKFTKNEEFPVLVKGTVNPYSDMGRKFTKIYVDKIMDIDEFIEKKKSPTPVNLNDLEQDILYDDISSISKYKIEREKANGIMLSELKDFPESAVVVGRVVGSQERGKTYQITLMDETGEEQKATVFRSGGLIRHLLQMPARSVILANLKRNEWNGRFSYILQGYERLGG